MNNDGGISLAQIFKEKGLLSDEVIGTKKTLISELIAEQNICIDGKIVSKRLQNTKDGKKFLVLTISDKSGYIRAIDWYAPESYDGKLYNGLVVRIKGKVVYYENRLQINVSRESDSIVILKDDEFDHEKFIESSDKDPEEMYSKIYAIIDQIKDPGIKKLVFKFFDEDENFIKEFKLAPAGMTVHHAYKSGLLEHTLAVVENSIKLHDTYNTIMDKDILIAGGLLHDIGKIREYSINPAGIDKTDAGELVGHIVMGAYMVKEKSHGIKELDEIKLEHIIHIVISHHGEVEYGSPIVPKTPEALLIHFCDNLDSKIIQAKEGIESTLKVSPDSKWSEYDKNMGRKFKIFNGGK